VRRDRFGTVNDDRSAVSESAAVDPEDDVGVEHPDERLEIAVTGGGEEGVDDASLLAQIGFRFRRVLHPAPRAAGELHCRHFGALEHRGDVGEGHAEHVVQNKREPLSGRGAQILDRVRRGAG
jgi:hypothetical protein